MFQQIEDVRRFAQVVPQQDTNFHVKYESSATQGNTSSAATLTSTNSTATLTKASVKDIEEALFHRIIQKSSRTVLILQQYLEKQTKKLNDLLLKQPNTPEDTDDESYQQGLQGLRNLLPEVATTLRSIPHGDLTQENRDALKHLMETVRNAVSICEQKPEQASEDTPRHSRKNT